MMNHSLHKEVSHFQNAAYGIIPHLWAESKYVLIVDSCFLCLCICILVSTECWKCKVFQSASHPSDTMNMLLYQNHTSTLAGIESCIFDDSLFLKHFEIWLLSYDALKLLLLRFLRFSIDKKMEILKFAEVHWRDFMFLFL